MHDPRESDASQYAADFRLEGYAIFNRVLPQGEIDQLVSAIDLIPDGPEVRRKRGVYGIRNLLEICPAVQRLAADPRIRRFVTPILGGSAFAVRAIFFDKVPGANWALGWHQDSVISVGAQHEVPGFVAWSRKAGVWQVQPPHEVLARMIAIRVHLDDCRTDNGPLRVIPGSHVHGWLDDELDDWKRRVPQVLCLVNRGGVVAMCPLVLHASAASKSIEHRRVIHLEYACDELPGDLDWNNRIVE